MSDGLFYFFAGLAATFVGTLPFGPINMSVVNITIKRTVNAALVFALGASLIEIAEASVAIFFGRFIDRFLAEHTWFQISVACLFIAIGLLYLFKKGRTVSSKSDKKGMHPFFQGVVIAMLNPQAIPFWLVTLAFLSASFDFQLAGNVLLVFLTGVFVGKFLALWFFALLSQTIKKRIQDGSQIVNRVFGWVLIGIGGLQLYKLFV